LGLLGHSDFGQLTRPQQQIALGAIHEPLTESELNGGLFTPMRRFTPWLFAAAISLACLLPNPESLVHVLERVGLVTLVIRGLMGHYQDFSDTLNGGKRRR